MSDRFYRAFEDRYRGSRELIRSRLLAYLPFLQALGGGAALDLGCGRGEWLELLVEQGFAARGVDLDEGMLAACRSRRLNVEQADALATLGAAADNSLALVSAFHLVEHIPFEMLQQLVREALRALRPGGLLILETPNPENLVVGATSFYLDPSHLRPLPPQLLDFVVQHNGFGRHKILRLQEAPELHTPAPIGLITVLEGASPDYAVVAQKQAEAPLLAPFEAAFEAEYGIALAPLAVRYDAQAAQLRDALEQRVRTGIAALDGTLGTLAAQADRDRQRLDLLRGAQDEGAARIGALEQRMAQAEHSAQAAQARALAAEQHIVALLTSSSWRVTAPLRRLSDDARRLKAGLKRRGKALLLAGGRLVLRQPRLKRLARRALARLPALERRLYALMLSSPAAPPPPRQPSGAEERSPRTEQAYRELKNISATRKP